MNQYPLTAEVPIGDIAIVHAIIAGPEENVEIEDIEWTEKGQKLPRCIRGIIVNGMNQDICESHDWLFTGCDAEADPAGDRDDARCHEEKDEA